MKPDSSMETQSSTAPGQNAQETEKEVPSPPALAFGLVFAVLFFVGSVIFFRSAGQSVVFDIRSRETVGELRNEYVKKTTRRTLLWFSTYRVRYSYIVNGAQFSGEHTLWLEPTHPTMPVYYSPDDPSRSRLARGMYAEESLYALLCLGFSWMSWKVFRKEVRLLKSC